MNIKSLLRFIEKLLGNTRITWWR